MQRETKFRIAINRLEKGFVATQMRVLHDCREVADRLVGVHAEEEGNGFAHGFLVGFACPAQMGGIVK